jgi:hypothetical protein
MALESDENGENRGVRIEAGIPAASIFSIVPTHTANCIL